MGSSRRRGWTARVGVAVAAAVLAAGCSDNSPPDDEGDPTAESAALRVQTVTGAERLDEQTRTEVEGAVGDVLSDYVVAAFLGEFPRQEFVQAFEPFTSVAARKATRDIDLLTAATARDATAVRATDLDARLSFLTQAGEVLGGTAKVHFAFDATMEDGTTRPLALDGRFMLVPDDDGTWSIFGYDVRFDDGDETPAEAESGGGA
ncbi:hypothetical protein IEZ26_18870 [Nocardioides cavernae]|uniref:Nuclear transport factor 2 family protein n=1 Tax=Nocardioides cavernae TaxID=1921566 RepID=A0ABR8NJR4_9ACTN|nr:hypothetical protein [Nocardioides cavernae]MBD3926689.1 hypothetical protein [Nocardioides cavernae]MBM7512411.1 hypothetical protein [Nocardioides cavernae]